MSPFAAVLCHDAPSLRMLKTALKQAEIDAVICRTKQQALELALGGQCSLLLADFALPEAVEVARVAALLEPWQKPTVLAIAGEWPGNGEAFQSGANRILYRPLADGQVKDALQEILEGGRKRGLRGTRRSSQANEDRRASRRTGIRTLVYFKVGAVTLPAIGIDVSEQGLAVRAADPIPAGATMNFRCVLPGTGDTLRGKADVIWTDAQGRAGMFFSHLPPRSRKMLKQWLSRGHANTANAVSVLLPPMAVGAGS
jgi:hypothetical protein